VEFRRNERVLHLTKKSVIRGLQHLTSPYGSTDLRSILTKAKHGIGVGIPNTYRIDLELLRDLNRPGRLPPATTDQTPSAGDMLTPGRGSTNDGEAGNAATLVEGREILTLKGQTNQRRAANSGFSGSVGAMPLPKREVSRRMRALAKQSALDIIARINRDKAITLDDRNLPRSVVKMGANGSLAQCSILHWVRCLSGAQTHRPRAVTSRRPCRRRAMRCKAKFTSEIPQVAP
jgi:hypothetical protein